MVFPGDHSTSALGWNVDLKLLHVTLASIKVISVKVIARFSVPMLDEMRHLLIILWAFLTFSFLSFSVSSYFRLVLWKFQMMHLNNIHPNSPRFTPTSLPTQLCVLFFFLNPSNQFILPTNLGLLIFHWNITYLPGETLFFPYRGFSV